MVTFHKMIVNYSITDHKNKNPLDNRKSNLRQCKHKENDRNKGLSKNNSSGITGVSMRIDSKKWRARIKVDDKELYLGTFINFDDAVTARLKAENKYYGEFAPQKYLYKQYNIQ